MGHSAPARTETQSTTPSVPSTTAAAARNSTRRSPTHAPPCITCARARAASGTRMMRSSTYSAQIFPLALSPFRLHRLILSPIHRLILSPQVPARGRRELHLALVQERDGGHLGDTRGFRSRVQAGDGGLASDHTRPHQSLPDLPSVPTLSFAHTRGFSGRTSGNGNCALLLLLTPAAFFSGRTSWKRHLKRLCFVRLQGTTASVEMGTRKTTGIALCTARWLSSSYGSNAGSTTPTATARITTPRPAMRRLGTSLATASQTRANPARPCAIPSGTD